MRVDRLRNDPCAVLGPCDRGERLAGRLSWPLEVIHHVVRRDINDHDAAIDVLRIQASVGRGDDAPWEVRRVQLSLTHERAVERVPAQRWRRTAAALHEQLPPGKLQIGVGTRFGVRAEVERRDHLTPADVVRDDLEHRDVVPADHDLPQRPRVDEQRHDGAFGDAAHQPRLRDRHRRRGGEPPCAFLGSGRAHGRLGWSRRERASRRCLRAGGSLALRNCGRGGNSCRVTGRGVPAFLARGERESHGEQGGAQRHEAT